MDSQATTAPAKRNVWLRGLYMLLMALIFQLSATLLGLIAVIQFVMVLLDREPREPNARLVQLGHQLGIYLKQIADFVTFATDDVPFPFNEWPAAG